MENFLSPAAIWFLIGFGLLLLEFALPGLIVFFFGMGAWVVAILCLFKADLSFNSQLIIFIISSLACVLLLRKWLRNKLQKTKGFGPLLEDEMIGKVVVAETDIMPGKNGKVFFKGGSWGAASSDVIAAGENVIITGNDSIVLIVRSTKQI